MKMAMPNPAARAKRTLCLCAFVPLCLSSFASAGEASFSSKPSAIKDGTGAKITFTLSAPTDVEVAVLDAQGKVVRHLAGGVLGGKNPPPAPLKPGLAQELAWEGKDDFGKAAAGGPFKVRVRAGTGVKFAGFISGSPNIFGNVSSLAADEEGNIYAMSGEAGIGVGMETVRVFTAEGRYLREVLPFPAYLPPDSVAAAAKWDAGAKRFRPNQRCDQLPAFYPWGGGARLVSASAKTGLVLSHKTNVYRVNPRGGDIQGPLPMWSKAANVKSGHNVPQLAVSPDGRYIYYANVCGSQYDTKSPAQIDAKWPNGRVYRQDTSKAGADPEKFYDLELPNFEEKKYWMPNAWNCRSAAYHVMVDSKGHVHVGDMVNHEIVEVDPDGKKVGATKVPSPERFALDEKGGAYYVLSRVTPLGAESSALKLLKIAGRGAGAKVAAELDLKMKVGRAGAGLCLGRSGEAVTLWISAGRLACVRETGGKLELVETDFVPKGDVEAGWARISADYERDEVYTNDGTNGLWRYDGRTGKGEALKQKGKRFHGVDLSVGYDGLLYVRSGTGYSGPLERYTRELEPAPYPTGTHVAARHIYSRMGVGFCEKGLGVGPKGEAYVSFMYDWNKYHIAGFGPDGKAMEGRHLKGKLAKKSEDGKPPVAETAIIGPIPMTNGGIRVDLAGNIYVGMSVLPKDHPKVDHVRSVGSVVRFPPEGGTVLGAVKQHDESDAQGPRLATDRFTLINATALYPATSPFSSGGNCCCVCRQPRFDVDRYGRVTMPHAFDNSVSMLDNAGNPILTFGAYGNFDSQYVPDGAKDRKPLVAVPEFPLAWPIGTAVTQTAIYTIDLYNRRVLRADFAWQAEESCDVR